MRLAAAALVLLLASPAIAQQALPPADWKEWAPLLGEWVADKGQPGGATGGFTLTGELQGRVLVRRNFADYPKSKERAAFRHDDLTVFSLDNGALRADYWDNEGYLIHYAVAFTKGEKGPVVVCTSEVVKAAPRFRFTYTVTSGKTMSIAFEIAPPGKPDEFKPYIQATLHKKK